MISEYDGYDGDEGAWRIGPSISSAGEHGFTLMTRMVRRLNYYGAYIDNQWTPVAFNTDRTKLEAAMRFMRENADVRALSPVPETEVKPDGN